MIHMVRTFGQPKRGLIWARVVTTALLLGPSFFSGCDVAPPGEWQVHPDIAVLTKRQEDCVESSRATFAVRSTRTIDRRLAEASIVPVGTHGSCNDFAAISPGDLSPAGTVLTDKVVIGTDGTTVLTGCSDNIVRHSPNPVAPSLAGSVVTS